ncbi:MAG: GTP-binding protein [Candidatus Lokiarchaeota archaeon]|nr:GTP-binding protein [Candidatus Lokiarchaeota archaeon]
MSSDYPKSNSQEPNHPKPDYQSRIYAKSFIYKVCVVGNGGVGKTSMVLRYCENSFKESYLMTIGSNFSTKTVELADHPQLQVKLQLWDLAGQKHFSFVRPPFYRGATGIIYVFDLTRRSSFADLLEWREEVEKVIGQKPCLVVGNKLDLAKLGQREVAEQDGEAVKFEMHAMKYFETSAKEGDSVGDIFKVLTLEILRNSGKI